MSRYALQIGWQDVPHLTEEQKATLLDAIPPHQRDARTKGVPLLGSGAIYPVAESEITCEPFKIPNYWPRCYAMDVGWNRTAAIWGAWNQEEDTVYLFSEHYRGQAEPSIHATAIKGRGAWIPGVIDPAARGRAQKDGTQLIQQYQDLGLQIMPADNSVEAGIYEVWERLSTQRLFIFNNLQNWLAEYRIYRRDEKGKIVKQNDHLMDCTRYLIKSGLAIADTEPKDMRDDPDFAASTRSSITGY
jgi:hypothetical protein